MIEILKDLLRELNNISTVDEVYSFCSKIRITIEELYGKESQKFEEIDRICTAFSTPGIMDAVYSSEIEEPIDIKDRERIVEFKDNMKNILEFLIELEEHKKENS